MSMICDTCHGTGKQYRDSLPVTGIMPGDPDIAPGSGSIWESCKACEGTGIVDDDEEGRMNCETCHGAGWLPARVLDNQRRGAWVKLPCGDCGGSGITHCCEGDREVSDDGEG